MKFMRNNLGVCCSSTYSAPLNRRDATTTKDVTTYPNDDDGDALRRVAQHDGCDMRKPMLIDFHVLATSEQTAKQIAAAAQILGYQVRAYGQDRYWTCQCSTRMLATYDGVIAIQKELAHLSGPLGGRPDGWGTFGNGPLAEPQE